LRVPVPELAGYVISRIGTPTAMSRLALRVPVRVTHLDTLVPEDYVLDLEMREGRSGALRASARPAHQQPMLSARRASPPALDQGQPPWRLIFAMMFMFCATMIIMALLYSVG